MISMLKRQRRRLLLFAICTCLPISALLVWSAAGLLSTGQMSTISLIALFVGVNAALMAIPVLALCFAPERRFMCDRIAITLIVMGPLTFGAAMLDSALQTGPFIQIGLWVCAAVLSLFDVPHRFMPNRTYQGAVTFRTRQSPYTIWSEHLPDPGLLDRHWSSELQKLRLCPRDPDVRIATFKFPHGQMRQQQTMTEFTMHESFAYDFVELDDDDARGITGSHAMTMFEHGPYRDVTLTTRIDDLPFRAFFSAWLDDILADEGDHHLARAKGLPDHSITGQRLLKAPAPQTGLISPMALPA